MRLIKCFIPLVLVASCFFTVPASPEGVNISIKGVDDGVTTTKFQWDRARLVLGSILVFISLLLNISIG